ncbi:MAG: oligosaccharide flippase family protein, partial [bacterium]
MSRLFGFLHQSSHYSVAQFLLLFSSAISFPILTRIFSPGEYGMMNLISNAIVIVLAVSKGGVQHGIVRFYNDYDPADPERQQAFVSSMLLGGFAIAALVASAWFFANATFAEVLIDDAFVVQLLLLS